MSGVKGEKQSEVGERLRRLLYLVPRALRDSKEGGAPLGLLAKELGVGVGQLVEDLGLLAQVGPPRGDPGEFVAVSVEKGRAQVHLPQRLTRPLTLTVAEAFSLLMGTRALRELDVREQKALDTAEAKIRGLLGGAAPGLEGLFDHLVVIAGSGAGLTLVPELRRAIRDRLVVHFAHTREGGKTPSRRGLDPYGMIHHAGSWYVVGRCHIHDGPRLFRLDRISELEVGEAHFEVPADFDLESYRRDRLFFGKREAGEARVRLDAIAAARVAGKFPPESLRPDVDGGAVLHLAGSDRDWLVRFVLGLGRHARVLAPSQLAQAVAAEARALRVRHLPT